MNKEDLVVNFKAEQLFSRFLLALISKYRTKFAVVCHKYSEKISPWQQEDSSCLKKISLVTRKFLLQVANFFRVEKSKVS